MNISEDVLRTIITISSKTRTGELVGTCPFCGKERHLYISSSTGLWECKRCWRSGNMQQLLIALGKTHLLGRPTVVISQQLIALQDIRHNDDIVATPLLSEVRLPLGFTVYNHSTPYLSSRGVDENMIQRWHIGSTHLFTALQGYCIMPILDNDAIRGWVARWASPHVPNDRLRYRNSSGTEFAQLLYGYDDIHEGQTHSVILTEGVFDKYAIDRALQLYNSDDVKCVSTFGKKISDIQLQKLRQKGVQRLVFSWDIDAVKEIRSYGAYASSYFNVDVAITHKKDFGDCSVAEVLQAFSNMISIDQFTYICNIRR